MHYMILMSKKVTSQKKLGEIISVPSLYKFGNHLLQVKCLLFAHNNLRTDQFDTPN